MTLQKYVRRSGPESDYHMMPPAEYHADTSLLIQMLDKGHRGVELDREARERLYTWIDLNVPYHGTWGEFRPIRLPDDRRDTYRLSYRWWQGVWDVGFRVVCEDDEPIRLAAKSSG